MNDPNDRFGVSADVLRGAIEAGRGVRRTGLYVPTRHEVATLSPELIEPILEEWIWQSPDALIPTAAQIAQVLDILKTRRDASRLAAIIATCTADVSGLSSM